MPTITSYVTSIVSTSNGSGAWRDNGANMVGAPDTVVAEIYGGNQTTGARVCQLDLDPIGSTAITGIVLTVKLKYITAGQTLNLTLTSGNGKVATKTVVPSGAESTLANYTASYVPGDFNGAITQATMETATLTVTDTITGGLSYCGIDAVTAVETVEAPPAPAILTKRFNLSTYAFRQGWSENVTEVRNEDDVLRVAEPIDGGMVFTNASPPTSNVNDEVEYSCPYASADLEGESINPTFGNFNETSGVVENADEVGNATITNSPVDYEFTPVHLDGDGNAVLVSSIIDGGGPTLPRWFEFAYTADEPLVISTEMGDAHTTDVKVYDDEYTELASHASTINVGAEELPSGTYYVRVTNDIPTDLTLYFAARLKRPVVEQHAKTPLGTACQLPAITTAGDDGETQFFKVTAIYGGTATLNGLQVEVGDYIPTAYTPSLLVFTPTSGFTGAGYVTVRSTLDDDESDVRISRPMSATVWVKPESPFLFLSLTLNQILNGPDSLLDLFLKDGTIPLFNCGEEDDIEDLVYDGLSYLVNNNKWKPGKPLDWGLEVHVGDSLQVLRRAADKLNTGGTDRWGFFRPTVMAEAGATALSQATATRDDIDGSSRWQSLGIVPRPVALFWNDENQTNIIEEGFHGGTGSVDLARLNDAYGPDRDELSGGSGGELAHNTLIYGRTLEEWETALLSQNDENGDAIVDGLTGADCRAPSATEARAMDALQKWTEYQCHEMARWRHWRDLFPGVPIGNWNDYFPGDKTTRIDKYPDMSFSVVNGLKGRLCAGGSANLAPADNVPETSANTYLPAFYPIRDGNTCATDPTTMTGWADMDDRVRLPTAYNWAQWCEPPIAISGLAADDAPGITAAYRLMGPIAKKQATQFYAAHPDGHVVIYVDMKLASEESSPDPEAWRDGFITLVVGQKQAGSSHVVVFATDYLDVDGDPTDDGSFLAALSGGIDTANEQMQTTATVYGFRGRALGRRRFAGHYR